MKKLLFTFLAVMFLQAGLVFSCTNILVTKGASTDGSTMITYAADSHVLYGELYFRPAAEYPDNTMVDIYEWDTGKYLGKIKQARKTYSVVGNMNEYQLAIGETTFGGREELIDTTGLIDYGSLIYMTLQRAKTAREAIKIMTDLVRQYGYYSSGESFSISDPNEVWILEMISKGPGKKDAKGKIIPGTYSKGAVWVAIRIPDGYISGHANQARITTFQFQAANNWNNPKQEVFNSPDVITFARSRGYFKGSDKEFSFSDTYAPLTFGGARFCEARVWAFFNRCNKDMGKYLDYAKGENLKNRMPLYIKPDKKLSVHDVMELMRDYYQNTPLDMSQDIGAGPWGCIVRWRPMTWKVDGVGYVHERAISTQQTGFSFVTQSRSWLPDPVGGILWFGVDDTYSTVYAPMYCGITKVPSKMAEGYGSMMEFKDDAAFWVFNQVSNFAYTRFNIMIGDIQKVQRELEEGYIAKVAETDKAAAEMFKSDKAKTLAYLTDFSCNTGNAMVDTWRDLYHQLFVKYVDGNVKTVDPGQRNPKVSQPGYGEEWLRRIAKETGDRYKAHGDDH